MRMGQISEKLVEDEVGREFAYQDVEVLVIMSHALQPLRDFDKSVVHEVVQLARFESLILPKP